MIILLFLGLMLLMAGRAKAILETFGACEALALLAVVTAMFTEVLEFRLVVPCQAGHAVDVAALITARRAVFAEGPVACSASIAVVIIHEPVAVAAAGSMP